MLCRGYDICMQPSEQTLEEMATPQVLDCSVSSLRMHDSKALLLCRGCSICAGGISDNT